MAGPEAPIELVLLPDDLTDSKSLAAALERVCAYWRMEWEEGTLAERRTIVRAVAAALQPHTTAPSLLAEISMAEKAVENATADVLQLTADQIVALEMLTRRRRVRVDGRAGTGKTILAVERARHLSQSGLSVLLLAGNRDLVKLIEATLRQEGLLIGEEESGAGIMCTSFGGLTGLLARRAAEAVVVPGISERDRLLALLSSTHFGVDALVVDEAQEVDSDVAAALLSLIPTDGPVYFFGDVFQADWLREPWHVSEFERIVLTTTCRNAAPIAELVRVLGRCPRARLVLQPEFVTWLVRG